MLSTSNFSKVYHLLSKRVGGTHSPENFHKEWLTTYYKRYSRLPQIPLGDIISDHADFFTLVKERKSRREYTNTPLFKAELSTLLRYSCGITGYLDENRAGRAQPSGGARFPIEVYPLIFRGNNDIQSGLYHYNVQDHALESLWEKDFTEEEIDKLFSYSWVKQASLVIVMTAIFWRNQNKYGGRGYRMVLQESGHIAQNIYLASGALGLGCCALAGTRDEALEDLLDIDGNTESLVYAVAIGK